MPLDIPYTFIAGTKAKASEVNSNFQAVKTITDQNEVNIAQAEIDITTLQTTKADLNGAIENRFEVADPNGNYDAVNLQTFERLTANTRDYISGFVLSKYSNDTISATPGSCYDSTYEYIFTSDSALQVSQSNLGANATYYVYITGGPDADNELVISSSDTTPELPVGATLFRRLGSFKTNSNSEISTVSTDSVYDVQSNPVAAGGYLTFPNGVKLMWGRTGNIGPRGAVTVTLPMTVTSILNVQLTLNTWSGRSSGDKNSTPPWVDTFTTTSFVAHNNHEFETWNLFWFAIAI